MHSFDSKKDYYAILGVTPEAEDVVIVAVYRVLVGRYHPDRWSGDPNVAHTKTAEINEAYSILSNSVAKAAYDKTRRKSSSFEETTSQASEIDETLAEMEDRWQVAVDIYPDLAQTRQRLMKTAHRLAFSYVALLLETKKFKERKKIAETMEKIFLEMHFGKNEEIINFVKILISCGFKDAIKALNTTIDVVGVDIEAETIIAKIKDSFDIDNRIRDIRSRQMRCEEQGEILKLKQLVREKWVPSDAEQLVRDLGYRLISVPGGFFSQGVTKIVDPNTNVTLYEGKSTYEMTRWVVKNLAVE